MSRHGEPGLGENPFCTRRVRPGALPYLFDADQSARQLVQHLRRNGWWGQILGPHGSGKSALLASLIPAIESAGHDVLLVELHDGQRRLPRDFWRTRNFPAGAVVVVDGYEQLGRLSRFWLARFCRRHKLGLLATAHHSIGFPDLFQSDASLPMAHRVVDELQAGQSIRVSPQEVAERFSRHQGNLREMLFDLYDLYEQQQR